MGQQDDTPIADETATTVTGDGVRLACHAAGDTGGPTIVFVHGYPDTHAVWERMVARLAADFHCVRYDVRGAGASSRPATAAAYRLDRLRADLAAVIDWACPHKPVHLVAHDWGSIQSWEAVTEPALAHRVASFTSISGPCLDHVGHWARQQWCADPRAVLGQLRRSWYMAAMQVPLLPELVWQRVLASRWPRAVRRFEGRSLPVNATLRRDGAHGMKLYRANVGARLLRPRRRFAQAPVQLVTPLCDPFVGPCVVAGTEAWVNDLVVTPIDAAHWANQTHPQALAEHCADFIHTRSAHHRAPA